MTTTLTTIFRDFAIAQSGTVVHLAVIGGEDRLHRFARWLAENGHTARAVNTGFDSAPFGVTADAVFELYDVILRLDFPDADHAARFIAAAGAILFARPAAARAPAWRPRRRLAPVSYDTATDRLYVAIRPSGAVTSRADDARDLVVDLGADGQPVGYDLQHASLHPEVIGEALARLQAALRPAGPERA